jgi:hypothetical protein
MNDKRWRRPPWLLCAVGVLLCVSGPGCSLGRRNAPVDGERAREVLRTALESWKKGDKVDALQQASPPIYVIDMEWQDGVLLQDYQVVGDGEEKDAHLFCPVKLTLRSGGGNAVTREVTYVISTAPNLTVSRKMF